MVLVEARNIWKTYNKGKENELHALRGTSIKIKKGDFIAILGPSGSGKSTLMHLIGCLDIPDKGEVYIEGKPISKMSQNQLSEIRSEKIGFVFQFFNLIPTLSALENVALPLMPKGIDTYQAKVKAKKLLEQVGLGERIHHLPSQLSGGEKQRVAIARAMINKPQLILADEPTGNLDSKTGKVILDLLKKINKKRKTAIVVVTHDLELTKYAHGVVNMRDGRITNGENKKSK